jgi:hypothetical protein
LCGAYDSAGDGRRVYLAGDIMGLTTRLRLLFVIDRGHLKEDRPENQSLSPVLCGMSIQALVLHQF